jgi:tetratricopeptide (TPR) repeat protein
MIISCTSCGAVNRFTESPRPGTAYQCGACGRILPVLLAKEDRAQYYELLELPPGASSDAVKRAYRDLVKIWHPDRFAHDPRLQQRAQDKLKAINAAYEQLQADIGAWPGPRAERPSPPPSGRATPEPPAPESHDPVQAVPTRRQRAAKRKLWLAFLSVLLTMLMMMYRFSRSWYAPAPETALRPTLQSPPFTPPAPSTADHTPAAEDLTSCQQWYALQDYARALACGQATLEQNADDVRTWSLIASCQEQLEQAEAAVQAYQQVLRLTPDDAAAHEHLGHLYAALKQDSEAVMEFRQALAHGAHSAELYQQLGALYTRQQRYLDAIHAYEQALRLKRDDTQSSYGLGLAYLQSGRRAEALRQYERLRRVDPQKAAQLYKLIAPEDKNQRQRNEGQKAPLRTEVQTQPDRAESTAADPLPPSRDYFTVGSTKEEVLAVQGTPDKVFPTMLRYGTSRVDFAQGHVISWKSKEPALKAKLLPSAPTPARAYFTLGSTKDEVLAVQGTPNEFSETLFRYGTSRVVFENGQVVGWKSKEPALKVPFELPHGSKRGFGSFPQRRFGGAE